jgi:amidase
VTRACLERIAEREPAVGAWEFLDAEQAIARAQALDQGGKNGALTGVPFGVKDIIDTADMPSQYGSPIYAGHQPKGDAACVALSRKAGAVLLGKTVTTEFANRHPARTRHPFDPERTPGGSSSGSAAAVADNMIPLSLGTQTTGSTIKPASFCGVFGYRPTHGELSCAGVKQSAGSLDTLGLYARSIEDIALYRDVLAGAEPVKMPAEAPMPRIGFCRTHKWDELEPATRDLFEEGAKTLRAAGAHVDDLTLPKEFELLEDAHRSISSYEFTQNYTWEIENYWDQISETLRNGRLKNGLGCTFEQYLAARDTAEHARQALTSIFDRYDVLLTTPVVGEAPIGLGSTGNSSFCGIWTVLHVPVLCVPVFTGSHNMPIGAQLIGRRSSDRNLFAFGQWIYDHLAQEKR